MNWRITPSPPERAIAPACAVQVTGDHPHQGRLAGAVRARPAPPWRPRRPGTTHRRTAPGRRAACARHRRRRRNPQPGDSAADPGALSPRIFDAGPDLVRAPGGITCRIRKPFCDACRSHHPAFGLHPALQRVAAEMLGDHQPGRSRPAPAAAARSPAGRAAPTYRPGSADCSRSRRTSRRPERRPRSLAMTRSATPRVVGIAADQIQRAGVDIHRVNGRPIGGIGQDAGDRPVPAAEVEVDPAARARRGALRSSTAVPGSRRSAENTPAADASR